MRALDCTDPLEVDKCSGDRAASEEGALSCLLETGDHPPNGIGCQFSEIPEDAKRGHERGVTREQQLTDLRERSAGERGANVDQTLASQSHLRAAGHSQQHLAG